jgi:hypothetical protein
VKRPFAAPIAALEKRSDRISEARLCCHGWIADGLAVMDLPSKGEKNPSDE